MPSTQLDDSSRMEKLSFAPNRDLLDSNFEGYKLSLESVPVYSSDLCQSVLNPRALSDSQLSFAHAKLAHVYNSNLIVRNPSTGYSYILESNSILQISDHCQDHKSPEVSCIWSSSTPKGTSSSDIYNPSLTFADESLSVYADGIGTLQFLSLSNSSPWKSIFKEEICGSNRSFVVIDALRVSSNELHTLLMYVDQSEKVSSSLKIEKHVSVVEWMTFKNENGGNKEGWTLDRVRRYAFYGPLEKCHLTNDGDSMYFITDKPFKVVFDSTLGDDTSTIDEKEEIIPPTNEEITPSPFHWYQTVEDIIVWILLPKETTKRDIKVEFKPSFLAVFVKGEPLVSGKLWNILESDTMSWTIKDRKLEINFSKVNEGMVWQRFLTQGLLDGDELADPNAIDVIQSVIASREDNQGSVFNMNELEDIDSSSESNKFIYVVNGDSHKTIAIGDLGGRQWLFDGPKSQFCIRHDVDGLVWSLETVNNLEHVATFSALGYVQASKQSRKFTVFAPNFTFAAIIDSSRHVYIYKQPSKINSDLRNRKSGTQVKAISKQSVITLDNSDEILGATASDHSIILCTKKSVVCIKVL
ncbi:nudC domain-containing protein 1 [Lepeophtheirus salmonis]|uniref:NudC domain-containing protein 1 n=1 Tax=Lepeophtheirus salmonis TaxID=72036 RepID=A0A0K2VCW6_LEPSM|nr:nudC domain-containing protein 1-like [Lepeophtheirus salmonis]